jgi:O-antigen ligase
LRLPPVFLWLQGTFLFLVLRGFVGFPEPVDFGVVVRVLAYVFALLVAAQVRGDFGIAIVRASAVLTGVILSVWVILQAAQGGFTYRADVDVDPNVVALFVGLGAVVSGAAVFARATARRRAITVVAGVLLVGLMGYAQLLVASRGVTIALVIALGILLLRAIAIDARQAWVALLLVGAVGVGLMLPGGQGLIDRFEGERVESAGSRTPIWEATIRDFSEGGTVELWLGHGFDASKAVVQRALGTVSSTHNAYLQVIHEFGILGLAAFLALHAWVLVRAWRTPGTAGWSAVGLVAFLLGVNLTLNAPDGFMYWTALGLAVAVATGPIDAVGGRRRAIVATA